MTEAPASALAFAVEPLPSVTAAAAGGVSC